jgi:hypothetical protein
MSRYKSRHRAPFLLIGAFAALLVFAASASAAAETLTGESTKRASVGVPTPETLLVKSTASYEPATGHAVISFTTAAPPSPLSTGEMLGGFSFTECSSATPPPSEPAGVLIQLVETPPLLLLESKFSEPTASATTNSISAPLDQPASKSVSGQTTTISFTPTFFVEAEYKCAVVFLQGNGGGSLMTVPLSAPPPPAPAPSSAPVAAPAAAPAPAPLAAPAKLSLVTPEPLKLKAKTWKTIRVKVANVGATATTRGSLQVKAAKGVIVKPEVQKLPVLTPGETFNLSVRAQLTGKAKPTSKLPVTVTAPGVSATGSIVLKLKQ